MDTIKYDIFISCKSEDYKFAEEMYDFLTENHFKTFLASKELRKLGDSQYRESIEEALDTAEHIIVFSSNPEYPSSKYVKYEWGLFVDEKISGRKEGNILTVLKGMRAGDLPIGLRRYESFHYETYKESLLDYVETNQHKEYLLHLKEEEREKEAQKREAQEREKQKQIILDQIKSLAETFVKKQLELDLEIVKLRNLSKSLGSDKKICRICNSEYDLEEEFCNVCGWKFNLLEGIPCSEILIKDQTPLLDISKKIFESHEDVTSNTELLNRIQNLERENKNWKISLIIGGLINSRLVKDGYMINKN